MDIKLSVMVPSVYGTDVFGKTSPVQVPCVNSFSQIDRNAFLKLPCSTQWETFRKQAAFLLQDSDSSLAQNSNSIHPACVSLNSAKMQTGVGALKRRGTSAERWSIIYSDSCFPSLWHGDIHVWSPNSRAPSPVHGAGGLVWGCAGWSWRSPVVPCLAWQTRPRD